MNVKLLSKVAKHISEEPRRLDMAVVARKSKKAPCGTAACIAGWAIILSYKKKPEEYHKSDNGGMSFPVYNNQELGSNTAEELLGIKGQSSELFNLYCWPEQFRTRYLRYKTARAKANVAVARIEHFIKTQGKE